MFYIYIYKFKYIISGYILPSSLLFYIASVSNSFTPSNPLRLCGFTALYGVKSIKKQNNYLYFTV